MGDFVDGDVERLMGRIRIGSSAIWTDIRSVWKEDGDCHSNVHLHVFQRCDSYSGKLADNLHLSILWRSVSGIPLVT